jgi:hypothetical protein
MSTSDPFLPFPDPDPASADRPDPREHDIDHGADVDDEPGAADDDAERAARHAREHEGELPFRTPRAGDRLSAEQLEKDLEGP